MFHFYFLSQFCLCKILLTVKDAINVLQRVLTHSFSKVVLQVLSDAKKDGVNAHVFVTESRPDESGILVK